jgi:dynein heavy chain, axonemal
MEKGRLKVLRIDSPGWLESLERSMGAGESVLIEGIKEAIDPLLEPILSRNSAKKGRFIRVGDRLVEYDEKFKLYLHTKLANPHYKPEIVARIHVISVYRYFLT